MVVAYSRMDGGGPDQGGKRLSDEGHKLYRIRQTCMKMLEKRGYNVLAEHVAMPTELFIQEFTTEPKREDMTLLVEKVGALCEVAANCSTTVAYCCST